MSIKDTRQALEYLLAQEKTLKQTIAETKQMLQQEMHDQGIRTLNGELYTITLAKRVNRLVDESGFRVWVSRDADYNEDDFYDKVLNQDRALQVADKELTINGEKVPWVHVSETEYISPKPLTKE